MPFYDEATQLHERIIIIDGLNASYFLDERVLRRLLRGGITAVNATIAVWHTIEETMRIIADYHTLFERYAGFIMPIHQTADIERAKTSNRVGIILGFQDTRPIGDSEKMLAVYRSLGVRIMQLTYNEENLVGCGCQVEDKGLTPFGRRVIAEMNRLGILIDLSHCGPRTTMEAIHVSEKPIAITHANPRAFCDNARNKSDEILKEMAKRNGVVGAAAVPLLLNNSPNASLEDYLDVIDYMVELLGVDHVALGPDFMEEMPEELLMRALMSVPEDQRTAFMNLPPTKGFASAADYPGVIRALLTRGYKADDVEKIVGGNWARLYGQVWQPHIPLSAEATEAITAPFGRRRTDPDYGRVPVVR